jgi:hypothetical protein
MRESRHPHAKAAARAMMDVDAMNSINNSGQTKRR